MTYEFRITVEVSGDVTEQEVREFISFEVGAHGGISMANPLMDEDSGVEVVNVEID